MITIDLMVLIDILVDGTNERAGTLTAALVMDIGLRIAGQQITGVVALRTAKLEEKEGKLGLPQDALDNLANIAKEMMVKVSISTAKNRSKTRKLGKQRVHFREHH